MNKQKELTQIILLDGLKQSRKEPGLSLKEIAEIIKQVLKPEEVEALKKEL